jgi:hypothetical protein
MYENGKMRHETFLGMGDEGIKENDGSSKLKYDIL